MNEKSVLVIDTPRSCAECKLRTSLEADHLLCIATLPRLKIDPLTVHSIKEHRCPLRPLPKKRDIRIFYFEAEDTEYRSVGFNECLAEITGETE